MALPLMPKATAVWLVENTGLTFDQIADFCGMHMLEVQAIADGEVATGIVGLDPIVNAQLTREELDRVAADPKARLKMAPPPESLPKAKAKGPRYTPVSKRQERPDAIAWLLRQYPELTDAQICKLVGTTKATLNAVRSKTHWKAAAIKPRDPVDLGMCSLEELHGAVQRARRIKARAEQRKARADRKAALGETGAADTSVDDAELDDDLDDDDIEGSETETNEVEQDDAEQDGDEGESPNHPVGETTN
jgi:hypothetical protein